jgi:hypothetical protein
VRGRAREPKVRCTTMGTSRKHRTNDFFGAVSERQNMVSGRSEMTMLGLKD